MSMIDPLGTGYVGEAPAGSSSTSSSVVGINKDNWLEELSRKAQSGDAAALDKLFSYYASESSAKSARDWTATREDTAYQRLIADLKKAGISPYILSGATPSAAAANQATYSGSQYTSQQSAYLNQKKADNDRAADFTRAILSFIGTALVAMAMFA